MAIPFKQQKQNYIIDTKINIIVYYRGCIRDWYWAPTIHRFENIQIYQQVIRAGRFRNSLIVKAILWGRNSRSPVPNQLKRMFNGKITTADRQGEPKTRAISP